MSTQQSNLPTPGLCAVCAYRATEFGRLDVKEPFDGPHEPGWRTVEGAEMHQILRTWSRAGDRVGLEGARVTGPSLPSGEECLPMLPVVEVSGTPVCAAHAGMVLPGSAPGAATVCTPIPAATLLQMSEVPPELLVEQQRTRADNAEERLRLAREALIRDGYFTADEVGDDIAPRLVEWLSHHRGRMEEAEDELTRVRDMVQQLHADAALARQLGHETSALGIEGSARRITHALEEPPRTVKAGDRKQARHVAEHHREQHTVIIHSADTPSCTATIEGPHTGSHKPVPCALPVHGDDQQHESAPDGSTKSRLHWTDHHAGATPHKPAPEATS